MDVSVVIPTARRPELLGRCLEALLQQSLSRERYEVIVVDDAPSEDTRQQVEQRNREGQARVRYLAVTGHAHGPAAARNMGWRQAAAPLIAFTDDDTVPSRDWLAHGVTAFAQKGIDAASGKIVMPLPPNPTDYERDAAGLERAGFVTANCFVRRAVLEFLDGFDERFALAWREDSDLFFRLLSDGYSLDHIDDAVVVHPVRPAQWGVSLKQQRKASYDALLYKKHPTLYTLYVRPRRPVMYYPMVAAFVLIIIGAFGGHRTLMSYAAAIWIGLTLWFAWRRLHRTSHQPAHIAEMLVTSALIPPLSLFWRARGGLRYRVVFW